MASSLTVSCPTCSETVQCVRTPTLVVRGEVFSRACPQCGTRFTYDGMTFPFVERVLVH